MASMGALIVRQVAAASDTPACGTSNDYDGRMGLRISAIFVILAGSLLGMKSTAKTSAAVDDSRCCVPRLCTSTQRRWDSVVGVFHSKVLWLGRHYRYGVYTRKFQVPDSNIR